MADAQANDNSTCVVCFKIVQYYSIGECDHPVCFECSTRMRVLCLQNECPICRQALARVVFTETVQLYKDLRNQVFADRLFERQYKIGFCSQEIKQAYENLLENNCHLCDKLPPFRSFSTLSDHMRKVHERYYCDLCVKHLKIFTSERKCYTRQELAHHRRKGDLDDTSHRGHPLCEFCEERFMDADELYRHLRKEHLYCHLCDADGRNHYYASHSALAHHFRTDHFLCEEGECAGQHLTAVFRSEIDLIAHRASLHGKGLTRNASRQARTLELQFNITPHAPQRTPRDSRQPVREEAPPSPPPAPAPRIDTRSDAHFPRLSTAAPAPIVMGGVSRAYKNPEGLARTDRNFPALDGGNSSKAPTPVSAPSKPAAAAMLRNSKPSVSIQLHSQPASASNFRLTQPTGNRISVPRQPLNDDDFPSLGIANDNHPSLGVGTVQPPKVTMINSQEMQALKKTPNHQTKKAPMSAEAFPALISSSAPTAAPQWVKVPKAKDKTQPAKSEPPPPRQPKFNPVADFPTLPVNNTKPKSKNITPTPTQSAKKPAPAPQIPSSQNDTAVNKVTSKKEKKKNAVKKENLMFDDDNYEFLNDKKIVRDLAHVLSSVNNNQSVSTPVEHKNIKTIADTSAGTVDAEKNRNGGGHGDFKLTPKDYPALGKADAAPKKGEAAAYKRIANGSVPPGFNKPRPPCDGMTFTNSSGQTFPAPVHTYIPPPDFESRNCALVQKFTAALGSPAAVDDFKVASRAFRDNIITANEFYQHCQTALGSKLDGLFLEMVALLPDIAKQQELVVGRKGGSELEVCSTCGQLIAPDDIVAHDSAHWPPLSR